jgi:hypothetical protein
MRFVSSDHPRLKLLAGALVLQTAVALQTLSAQVIIDGFEVDEGHFASNPNTASGTSQGFIKAGATAAVADRVTTDFFTGSAAQFIMLDDDPTVAGSPALLDSWRLRHLSGGGTPANNLSLTNVTGNTTYVGYWLKTSSSGMEASIGIDDGAALEIGAFRPIQADGQWHLYQWQFQDAADWDAFAGTGPNGQIDSVSVTIDSVLFRGGPGFPTGSDFDASFVIDDVSWNPNGQIPEPSGIGLLALGSLLVAGRRRWCRG